jgi:uncharacterized protein (DUF2249 family)
MTHAAVTLDVRLIEPRFRHALIFGIFQHLPPGECLQLTNDHDPKPLHYQFQAEAAGAFNWNYVETGPERWQVLIGKTGETAMTPPSGRCCG